ncbi:MAG: carbon-nitrogen hydrolase family protein [Firmicutes bacterium]|nr:carbon-nitrogen hydrolase family protein [Bacillota bacterium]
MPYPTITIGMGQMLVKGGDLEGNLRRARRMIEDAAQTGCRVIVLPECLDVGWTDPSARELAQPIPGPTTSVLADAAKENEIYVVAGLTERAGQRLYNSAVLIDPQGDLLHVHRKINELNVAQGLYSIGDRLGVVSTPFGVVGLSICADNFTSSLAIGHVLCRMGAHFIFSPSCWVVEATHDQQREPYGSHWRESHRQLTAYYGITMVSVSSVGRISAGPWQRRKAIGCSLAMGPGGVPLVQAPYGEEAEGLFPVRATAVERTVAGTEYAPYLKAKGYNGP